MPAPGQTISPLTAFIAGVLLTLLVFSVAFALGRAASEGPPPRPIPPNPYPTLTSAPAGAAATTPTAPNLTPVPPPTTPPTTASATPPTIGTPTAAPPTSVTPNLPPADATLRSAISLIDAKGYQVIDSAHFHSGGPLGVLIGLRMTNGEPTEYAFFFVNGQYIGTDLPQSSASMSVASQTGDTVVVRYALYRTTDPECCPSGGFADVPYHWDGTHLHPLASFPTYEADAELSRR
jgi:hypothetical protein